MFVNEHTIVCLLGTDRCNLLDLSFVIAEKSKGSNRMIIIAKL